MNSKWLSLTSSLSVIPKEEKLVKGTELEFTPKGDYRRDDNRNKIFQILKSACAFRDIRSSREC
jgi:hypothetical protein